jgi:uncharacterized membrane protein
MTKRVVGLDIFRGYAILLMVIFHFSFDLNNFDIVALDLQHDLFWHYFRYVIVSMFVFSAGISLFLAYSNGINLKKLTKRVLTLSVASLLVSIGSYTQFPNTWIYFGILHFFLFSSIFGLLFLRLPKLSFFIGVSIIVGYSYGVLHMHWLYNMLKYPLHLPLYYTEDLANIFPWFGVFLLGISFSSYRLQYKIFDNKFFNAKHPLNKFFSFIGKHSLLIYLVHQPILFGLFMGKNYLGL